MSSSKTRANDWHKSLKDFVRRHANNLPASVMNDANELMASHLTTGMQLQMQGLLSEAIVEYSKEHNRELKSSLDAEIVQTSYWHVAQVYRKLGELDQAIIALLKAEELLEQYHVGTSPHYDLAEIFIKQGKVDEAIEACEKGLRIWSKSSGLKQKLIEAQDLKQRNG